MCNGPERSKWRLTLLREVRAACEKIEAGQALVGLLLGGLARFFDDCQVEFFRHPAWLHGLTKSQDAAGWEQVPYGRFSKLWAEAHESLLSEKGADVAAQNSGLKIGRAHV